MLCNSLKRFMASSFRTFWIDGAFNAEPYPVLGTILKIDTAG